MGRGGGISEWFVRQNFLLGEGGRKKKKYTSLLILFSGNFTKFSPLPENSFTLQPISVIIQKGVIEPILERYNVGSQKLMRYLHEISLLQQNLVNLRAFFLMEAGFAFHQFTISLFEKVDRGEVLGSYELNRILQDSLICAGSRESYPNA